MKILIFIDSFFPGEKGGGTIVSIKNLAKLLHEEFDILICTKNHDLNTKKTYERIIPNKLSKFENLDVLYLDKINVSILKKTITDFTPDIIYINSFFSVLSIMVIFINNFQSPKKIVISPRGELQENALKIKFLKKFFYLKLFNFFKFSRDLVFLSTSDIEKSCVKNLFRNNKLAVIPNIVDLQDFKPICKNENFLKLVFFSRIVKKKNLLFALTCLAEVKYDVVFDIYGPIEDNAYWNKCLNVIKNLPSNIIINYKGCIPNSEVYQRIREYHALLLPSVSENFGHAIVESMVAGLVPIISNNTPWVNLQDSNAGWSLSLNDKDSFVEAISSLCLLTSKNFSLMSKNSIDFIHSKIDNKKAKKDLQLFFSEANE